jgi:hypothetical protein
MRQVLPRPARRWREGDDAVSIRTAEHKLCGSARVVVITVSANDNECRRGVGIASGCSAQRVTDFASAVGAGAAATGRAEGAEDEKDEKDDGEEGEGHGLQDGPDGHSAVGGAVRHGERSGGAEGARVGQRAAAAA